MLLHQTPLLDLLYEPKTDILRVNWPDTREAEQSEIEQSLERLKGSVTTYFITRMLMDTSQTSLLYEVETLREIWQQVFATVTDTKLEKIARIKSHSPTREALAQEAFRQIAPETTFPHLSFSQFLTEEDATKWLLESDTNEN
jgi:hypothetical protein